MEKIKVLFCYDKVAILLEGNKEEYLSRGVLIDTGNLICKKSFPRFKSKGYLTYINKMKSKYDLYAVEEITSELVVVGNQILVV